MLSISLCRASSTGRPLIRTTWSPIWNGSSSNNNNHHHHLLSTRWWLFKSRNHQNKTNPATKKCDTTTSDQNRLWNETGKSGRGKNFFFFFFFSALHSVGQQLILGCCVFTFFVFLPLLFFHLFDSHPILFFMSAGRVSAVPPQGLARIPPKPRPLLHKLVQFKSRFFALLSAVRVCVCYSRKNMSASRGAVPDVNHFIRAPHFPFTNLFFFLPTHFPQGSDRKDKTGQRANSLRWGGGLRMGGFFSFFWRGNNDGRETVT